LRAELFWAVDIWTEAEAGNREGNAYGFPAFYEGENVWKKHYSEQKTRKGSEGFQYPREPLGKSSIRRRNLGGLLITSGQRGGLVVS